MYKSFMPSDTGLNMGFFFYLFIYFFFSYFNIIIIIFFLPYLEDVYLNCLLHSK